MQHAYLQSISASAEIRLHPWALPFWEFQSIMPIIFFFHFIRNYSSNKVAIFFLFHCYLNVFIQSVSSPLDTTQMQQWYVSPTQLLICESNEMHTRAPCQMGWMQSSGLVE